MYIVKTTSNSYLIGQANNQSDVPNGPIRRGLFKPQSIRLNLMNHFFFAPCALSTHTTTHAPKTKHPRLRPPDTNQLQSNPIYITSPLPRTKACGQYLLLLFNLPTHIRLRKLPPTQIKCDSTVLSLDLRLRNGPRLRRVFFPPFKKWTISVNFSDFMNF